MTEYPRIAKQIDRVRLAPHGTKRRKAERLVKMRTASLKRELRQQDSAPRVIGR